MQAQAIIPSAGLGKRMGGVKKPFILLRDKPILAWTLDVFQKCESIDNILIVTAEGDETRIINEIVNPYHFDKVCDIVIGGETRQESVFNALCKVRSDADIVVIHDAVRPFVTEDMILKSIEQADQFGSAIVAVPVKDTIKESNNDGFVSKTLDRQLLWSIQTPQSFKYKLIMQAHRYARENQIQATDDASLIEQIGHKVKIIMGSYDNIKITTVDDIVIAEAILKLKGMI
ncbi:TPA: 2-C-methyl-D-erythritol 4-phosphate cytidylyltransferase [Candidatus Poribacteria bacterium]|nr:2-C-methyl-D-erythritol 4-phosphate cytidylyltransferase [Candidatus Poribacteria bacterium]